MGTPAIAGRAARGLALAAVAALVSACLAQPPAESAPTRLGTVRAATRARAEDVARAVDHLAPQVESVLPGARLAPLEVWVQETPTLYVLRASTYSDTDGFWAEGVRRIHLRDAADHLERTLAHELVHASLAPEWDALPGTLEEGLCDVVAARIVPEAAARLRAGRLATAAAALGGLPVDVELWIDPPSPSQGLLRGLESRLRIVGEGSSVDPADVFVVRAGLSTSRAAPEDRRAYYGLGFLVATRIVERAGVDALHALCLAAGPDGEVEPEPLLAAAGLDPSVESFRAAILDALGPADLREILRLHPVVLVEPLLELLGPEAVEARADLVHVRGRVSIPGSPTARVQVADLTALRPRLEARAAARRAEQESSTSGKTPPTAASDRSP